MRPLKVPAIVLMLTGSLGCLRRSSPEIFHTLRPLALIEEKQAPTASLNTPMALEVMPVRLPEALQRPQLVAAIGPDTLEISETHRWGNGLDKDMQRVLVENLSILLNSDAVVAFPYGERVKAGHRLEVDVQRCDGRPGGVLTLQATWMITPAKGGPALMRKRVTLEEPVPGLTLDALAAAHSRIMEALSREIAGGMNAGMPR